MVNNKTDNKKAPVFTEAFFKLLFSHLFDDQET